MCPSNGHDGHTFAVHHCTECPRIGLWPRKHLVLGTCPRCGKLVAGAWRMAAALRLVDERALTCSRPSESTETA